MAPPAPYAQSPEPSIKHPVTSNKTPHEDRVPLLQKLFYGCGALVNNLLGAAIGVMSIILIEGLKMNPALVGTLMGLPRLTDALTDPIMGYLSDRTRSRWGRRRPYIFFGALFSGILFALLWQLPEGQSESFYFWFFLIGSILFYLGYTAFATPWVALGYELTPDYHERTRVMGTANFMGQSVWLALPWFYAFMQNDRFFSDPVEGARSLAILIGVFVVVAGIVPAIFCREKMLKIAQAEDSGPSENEAAPGLLAFIKDFLKGFMSAIKCLPFVKLCIATFLVFNGFMLVSAFSSFVLIYYVSEGDNDKASVLIGWFGTATTISTFCVIALTTWLATRIGKRRTFFICISISLVGYALKWVCYSIEHPHLILFTAPLIAFGLGSLFTLMGSMVADVCDLDELQTGHRREGMFGSIFWWVVKLGMALALALSGHVLNLTGFDVELGGGQSEKTFFLMKLFDVAVPVLTSAIAMWAIFTFPISQEKARAVRLELERRRGK